MFFGSLSSFEKKRENSRDNVKNSEVEKELQLLIRYPSKYFILEKSRPVINLKHSHKFYLKEFEKLGGIHSGYCNFEGKKIYIDDPLFMLENYEIGLINSYILILFYEEIPLCYIYYFKYKGVAYISQIQGLKIDDRKANVISSFNYSNSLLSIVEHKILFENELSLDRNIKLIKGISIDIVKDINN